MGGHSWFVIAFAAFAATVTLNSVAEESATPAVDDPVLVLTKDNFDDTLKDNDYVLVKFYAPWCGHCKRMAPAYSSAAKTLKEKGSKVILAKVDAVAETELSDKHGVHEFPTITWYRKQKPEKYTGGRTTEAILEWVDLMTGPAVLTLAGKLDDVVTKDSPVVFYGSFSSKDSEMAQMFEMIAAESRALGKFYATYEGGDDKVTCARHEEGNIPFEGKTAEDMRTFFKEESFPLLGAINGENFRKYVDRDQGITWFCGSEKEFNEHKANIREAAKNFRKDYSFVWLDTDQFKGHAEGALGITELPGLVIQAKSGRYILPGGASAMDSNRIVEFMKDVAAGKVERSLKSEPVPETNEEPVKVVVGKTFEQMVVKSDKDIFLEIYAPWCGYCKSFEPIYRDFAEKVKDLEHVVVAKMDGTANETPLEEYDWSSFPTVYFVKAGERTPMKFEGSRTVEGLMEFLEKNTSTPIKKSDKGEEL